MTWISTTRKRQEKDSLGEGRALGVGVRAGGVPGCGAGATRGQPGPLSQGSRGKSGKKKKKHAVKIRTLLWGERESIGASGRGGVERGKENFLTMSSGLRGWGGESRSCEG